MANYEDLSLHPKPISGFLQLDGLNWPVEEAHIKQFELTDEQIQQFETNGFIAGIKVLSDGQLEALRRDLVDLMDPAHPKHKLWHEYNENEAPEDSGFALFHSLGAWRISESYHDLVFHPRISVPAGQLLKNPKVRLWHDQIFCKPAQNGSVVAWHQDYSYWTRTKPMNHLTVHIALDDQYIENGGLCYIPGSHRWPLLPITSRHFSDMDSIQSVLTEEQRASFHPICANLKAGEAAFHHALTVHGSFGNTTDTPRRACVVNVMGDGTVADADGPLLEGIPAVGNGNKLDGQFFPLLRNT